MQCCDCQLTKHDVRMRLSGMAADMVPVLSTYHTDLVRAMSASMAHDRSLVTHAVVSIVSMWPTAQQAQSSKEVLLLEELQSLLELMTPADFGSLRVRMALTPLLQQCIRSEHCRIAQRVAEFWTRSACVLTLQ